MYDYTCVGIVSNMAIPQITIYGISGMKGLLIDKPLTVLQRLERGLIINLSQTDEKVFVKSGIATISLPVLLSIAGGCSYDVDDINDIFRKSININYKHIFFNERAVDFTVLFRSLRFWDRIAGLICECLDIIRRNGLMEFLLLEIQTVPILHRMFDEGYPLDAKRVMGKCVELRNELSRIKRAIKKNRGDISELLHLRQKAEDKLRRIPCEIYNSKSSKTVISCNFRSIGTDTFRITTNHANVQGLPKEIRRCFLPRHGDMLIEYDMVSSQVIILACLADEDSLIRLYAEGEDLYLHIVAALTGKQAGKITKRERDVYKAIILQMLYGAGISTMQGKLKANGINFSCTQVKDMRQRFYQSFPAIREYSDRVKIVDSVTLPMGRRWNMEDSVEPYKRLPYIMQYVESMILREILVLLDRKAKSTEIWLYLCIHDSVFVETNSTLYAEMRAIVRKCFNQAMGKYFNKLKKINLKEDVIYDRTTDIK